jgi:hypothetical protein
MRKAHLGLAAVAGLAAAFVAGTAIAEPYKWCAVYSVRGGASNCGFVTLEQCRATVSGIGGFCTENNFYTGPEQTVRHKRKRHQG